MDKAIELGINFGVRFVTAVVILAVGLLLAKVIRGFVRKLMSKAKVDATITQFIGNLVYIASIAIVAIAVLEQIGISTTSFVAVLGAAGLAIGLALQGSLSNFASGFLLVIFRPFKVGDVVEISGATGKVEEISLFTTTLNASDNKKIIIPNGKVYNNNIINFTANTTRRVELIFTISYEDNIDQAKQIFTEVISKERRILSEPAPKISISELGERGVLFNVNVWVDSSNYGAVREHITEQVKKTLDRKGFTIPSSQQDAYLYPLKMLKKMFF